MSKKVKVVDGRKISFTILENDIIDKVDVYSKNELLAYMVLARYANDNKCYPGYTTIAAKMRCSRQSAIDAIASLEKKGVIKKKIRTSKNKKENQTNVYTLIGTTHLDYWKEMQDKKEDKKLKAKQIKELNEHENVLLFKDKAPHIRLGRLQKLDIINLDYCTLEDAIDRALLYNAKTLDYILMTYDTILEEDHNDKAEVKEFMPKEFVKTEHHQAAYINYIEKGFDQLAQLEIELLQELHDAGIVYIEELHKNIPENSPQIFKDIKDINY